MRGRCFGTLDTLAGTLAALIEEFWQRFLLQEPRRDLCWGVTCCAESITLLELQSFQV